MPTTLVKRYQCTELHRFVPVIQITELVSFIGSESAELLVLSETCWLANHCPMVDRCPFRAE